MRFAIFAVLVSAIVACAPRSTKTHFDRWAEQTAKRKSEEAEEARIKEWIRAQAMKGTASLDPSTSSQGEPSSRPRAPEMRPPPRSSARPGAPRPASGEIETPDVETPKVETATKSRVIRPSDTPEPESTPEDDDEAIY